MPARSAAQQKLFAIAAHNPDELYKRNKLLANLPKSTLREFAATKRTGLPKKVKQPKRG